MLSLLFVVIVLCAVQCCCGVHVFTIGDSIDRYTVEDFCFARGDDVNCGGSKCSYWATGGGIPTQRKGYPAYVRCDMGNDSYTTLHNYGSNDVGPYFCSPPLDNGTYSLTPQRIDRGLELYFDRIGIPDLVMYHGTQWDIQGIYERGGMHKQPFKWDYEEPTSQAWIVATTAFEQNMHRRVTDVEDGIRRHLARLGKVGAVVNVGLRTAVWNPDGGILLHEFNKITRRVAVARNVTLFDLDNDVWGAVGWDYTREKEVLRDFIHPNRYDWWSLVAVVVFVYFCLCLLVFVCVCFECLSLSTRGATGDSNGTWRPLVGCCLALLLV